MRIEISNLCKSYGKKTVLSQVSLTLEAGITGVVGPNGAGKTTLFHILSGNLAATEGSVTFFNNAGKLCTPSIGYLPQALGYYSHFTAPELLEYMVCLKEYFPPNQSQKEYVSQLLQAVNLQHDCKKRIGAFSGGMKQRLGIAQALVGNPDIILLDEPTAGLDPIERIRFRNLLATISRQTIVLIATHIVSDIDCVAQNVALFHTGCLLHYASPSQIIAATPVAAWEYLVDYAQIFPLTQQFLVSQITPVGGQYRIRLLSEHAPLQGAQRVALALEDVCFYHFGVKSL